MKLAAALALRKSNNEQLRVFVKMTSDNAYSSHEDDDPNKLMTRYLSLQQAQEKLLFAIGKTNRETILQLGEEKLSLDQLRIRRDMSKEAYGLLAGLPNKRTKTVPSRVLGTAYEEIAIVLDYKKAQAVANQFARTAREIDEILQSANWTVDLLED